MAHELELDRDRRASFVYNAKLGYPWHQLGTPFDRGITLDEALVAARIRPASQVPVYAMTPDGFTEIDTHRATIMRDVDDERWVILDVPTVEYKLVQYVSVAELAFAIVGADPDAAILDTMGQLFDGRRFFGFIDFGLVESVLPSGAVDRAVRGLGFMSSHDRSQAITFYKTAIRAVCNNTLTFGINDADRLGQGIIRIRHTESADERLRQVRSILGLQYGGDAEFDSLAARLDMEPGGHDVLERVIRKVWPEPDDDATERTRKIWENRADKVHSLYEMPSNQGGYGDTGWAVFNTVGEYLDHFVGDDPVRRARNSIDPSSGQAARKRLAAEMLLAV